MVFQKSISPQQAASNLVKNAVRIPSLATGGKKQTTSIRWQVGGVGELSPLNFKLISNAARHTPISWILLILIPHVFHMHVKNSFQMGSTNGIGLQVHATSSAEITQAHTHTHWKSHALTPAHPLSQHTYFITLSRTSKK